MNVGIDDERDGPEKSANLPTYSEGAPASRVPRRPAMNSRRFIGSPRRRSRAAFPGRSGLALWYRIRHDNVMNIEQLEGADRIFCRPHLADRCGLTGFSRRRPRVAEDAHQNNRAPSDTEGAFGGFGAIGPADLDTLVVAIPAHKAVLPSADIPMEMPWVASGAYELRPLLRELRQL
jgi:hypothetical protein